MTDTAPVVPFFRNGVGESISFSRQRVKIHVIEKEILNEFWFDFYWNKRIKMKSFFFILPLLGRETVNVCFLVMYMGTDGIGGGMGGGNGVDFNFCASWSRAIPF